MTTFVGNQNDFAAALKDLIELDYDAIEAYGVAINGLDSEDYKARFQEFKEDHQRHVDQLSELLRKHREEPPTGPSVGKQWITKGKVFLAEMIGDDAILKAMLSNEIDTNTAYQRINERVDKWEDAKQILEQGLEDEKRHKEWLAAKVK